MEELQVILETIEGFSGMATTVLIVYFVKEYLIVLLTGFISFMLVYWGYRLLSSTVFSAQIGSMCGYTFPFFESEKKSIREIVRRGLERR